MQSILFLRLAIVRWEIGCEFFNDFLPCLFQIHVEFSQNPRGHTAAILQQTEQQMLRANISMPKQFCALLCQREHFLHAWRVGDVAEHLLVGTAGHQLLNCFADGFKVQA